MNNNSIVAEEPLQPRAGVAGAAAGGGRPGRRSVFALAGMTVRMAFRSRIFLLLLVGVFFALFAVPLALKSDGTLCGHVQLLLHYSLGFAALLLMPAALWLGAGGVALEVEQGHAQLLFVKPVSARRIWLGKWLGLLALDAVLAIAAAAPAWLAVRHHAVSGRWDSREKERLQRRVLVAMRPLAAEPVLDAGAGEQAPDSAMIVRPGGKADWRFRLPARFDAESDAVFKFKFHLPSELSALEGTWEMKVGGRAVTKHGSFVPGVANEFALPARWLAGADEVKFSFLHNAGSSDVPVLFRRGELVLYVKHGEFLPNFMRAMLIVFFRLGLLSALGLTLGCLFSFPVAAFSAFGLFTASFFSGGGEGARAGGAAGVGVAAAAIMARAAGALLRPLTAPDPLELLAEGALVSWQLTLGAAAWTGGYVFVLAAVGAAALRRREMGLYG